MITADLKSLTRQDLTSLARESGLQGYSGMTKDDLVAALRKSQQKQRRKAAQAIKGDAKPGRIASAPKRSKASKSAVALAETKASGGRVAASQSKSSKSRKATEAAGPSSKKSSVAQQPTTQVKASKAAKSAPTRKSTASTGEVTSRRSPESKSAGSRASQTRSARGASKSAARLRSSHALTQASRPEEATGSKQTIGDPKALAKTASLTRSAVQGRSDASPSKANSSTPKATPVSAKSARIRKEMLQRTARAMQNKDISNDVLVAGSAVRGASGQSEHVPHKDRVVLIVRDSYWLQADWEVTRSAVDRVRVAMSEKWHTAIPVLRLLSVGDSSSNRAEQTVRDIPIHGGISTWYVDVEEPPSRYRVVVGYLAENDRFYSVCRSNIVETPRPGAVNRIDEHWRDIAEDYERIYSLSGGNEPGGAGEDLRELFEQRLQRTMPTRGDTAGSSDTEAALDRHRALPLHVDAELIIYGSTSVGATVLLSGEPVKLRPDGTFTVRVELPDKRQVFPVVAQSRDGMKQRTTVVAVERNTKVMEQVDRDANF